MTGLSSTDARKTTGIRAAIPIAASRSSASISIRPPICSFDSAKGPSVTIVSPSRTRTVFAVVGLSSS